ncbi:MAG: VWA domain-containing protein [Armatimonadetes bacterium]|nr:VWA domain-containing protein [Armatimonadota bacterium]
MAEALRLRTALDKSYRPLDGEFLTTVLVELAPQRRLQRLPLNLCILLDTSESMGGEKLQQAEQACLALLDSLDPSDIVAIVTFSSHAHVLLRAQSQRPETRETAALALGGLRAEGVTSLLRGLDEAYNEVRRHAGPDRTSFVILLSDGYPTTPQGYVDEETDPYIRRVDREMRERGISLTTIGLGDAANYEAALLRRLADDGNGQFLYCRQPGALGEQFSREFQRIQRTVLTEVELSVRHLGGTLRRLWRVYPDKKLFDLPAMDGGGFSVPLGSFQDEQPQAYLLDIVTAARPGQQPERARLLEVQANWRQEGEPRQVAAPVVYEYTADERALSQRNPEVVRLATECLDALLENHLEEAVTSGDRAQQTAVLARKKQLTRRLGKAEATQILEEMEEALARGEPISPDALARSNQATRPTQRLG